MRGTVGTRDYCTLLRRVQPVPSALLPRLPACLPAWPIPAVAVAVLWLSLSLSLSFHFPGADSVQLVINGPDRRSLGGSHGGVPVSNGGTNGGAVDGGAGGQHHGHADGELFVLAPRSSVVERDRSGRGCRLIDDIVPTRIGTGTSSGTVRSIVTSVVGLAVSLPRSRYSSVVYVRLFCCSG